MRVIAFDQSLTATGWAIIDFSEHGNPVIVEKGTIRTEPKEGAKGFHDTIPRCDSIARAVHAVMVANPDIEVVVHEMPGVPGQGQLHKGRTDASLMSCIAVRTACHVLNLSMPIVMISANAAKRTLTGLATAEKDEVRAAVFKRLGATFKTNTNVTDAIAAGIAAWERGMIAKAVAEMAA